MTLLYRIFSLIINVFGVLYAAMIILMIPLVFSNMVMLLPAFIIICVFLYTWFSFKFRREVLIQQKEVSRTLKDWIRVNGFVAIFFSVSSIVNSLFVIQNPNEVIEQTKNLGVTVGPDILQAVSIVLYVMLAYSVILLTHILWTFALMKKYQEFFK